MPGSDEPAEMVIHASCVALGGRAVLIRGASGRGKSGLALDLLAMGAELVADDRTRIWRRGDQIMADAPATIRGLIEARGIGILTLPSVGPRALALIVDMDRVVADRLPPPCHETVMGVLLPCFGKVTHRHFPAAILLYLRHAEMT